ncbi:MAG: Gfo/Idh/MocA family oxidoreductase [Lentisphaerae bacterium]|nr:Gfo/Idh/MocA family oxidoreductase [Lentisphaerota bacterium]
MNRKLKMGMVGGGRDAFIGGVHRMAAQMDGQIELVCGAFSSTPQKSKLSGKDLHLPADRVYGTYREMIRKEGKLPEGDRMDFICIVTPNNMHYPIAMAALDGGFHVACDKPMTLNLDEAQNLERKIEATGQLFCLTHNYTGYPMVKEGRDLIARGKLGAIRRVVVEYPQGWLVERLEATGQKQASWRTDARFAGASCCIGDIGSHCHNLAEYMTGSRITEVCADLNIFVKGRTLDDDGSVLIRFENGARGMLWASQVAVGEENALNIRIYGDKGTLEWHQQEPNSLIVRWPNKPAEVRRTSTPGLSKVAAAAARLPAGHTEGYLESFANIYSNFAQAMARRIEGKPMDESKFDYPKVRDGVRGMFFIDTVVKSAAGEEKWLEVPE